MLLEKEVVQRIFKELFDSPRQLTGIKSLKTGEFQQNSIIKRNRG